MRGLRGSPAAWFIQGTAVHSAVEAWEKSYRSMKPTLVLSIYADIWDQEEAKSWKQEPEADAWQKSGVKKTKTDLADRLARGRDQVITYMENTRKERLRPWTTPEGWVASEVPFEEEFDGVLIRGFIDLVMEDPDSKALLVRDLKTGTQKPVGPIQLKTYAIALKKKYGVDVAWGDYWMCKDGGPSSPINLGDIPDRLIVSQYQIMDAAEKGQMYGANIGDHCRRCDVARHCPYVGGTAPEGTYMLGT